MFFESLLLNLVAFLATAAAVIYAYFQWSYQYWKRKGIPYLEPKFPRGNGNPLKPLNESIRRHYIDFKKMGAKFGGIFIGSRPLLIITDLDLMKDILVKNFNVWVSRGLYYNEQIDPLSAHLFAIDGPKWKTLRTKLSPTFTSGKMKLMFNTLVECGGPLQEFVDSFASRNEPIDIKDVMARYTTNVIGSCAFGIDCNSFQENENKFVTMSQSFFRPTPKQSLIANFAQNNPGLAKLLKVKVTPKATHEFYTGITTNLVEHRQKNNVTRNDFMQLLIELKNKQEGLTMEEISAQAYVFLLAGFETSSSTLTFACYELSREPEIQEKLRQEILDTIAKHDDKITYEAVQDMKYLTQVVEETLRLDGPVLILRRVNSQPYKIPGTDVVLDEGTQAIMSVYGIQHDPEIYPDPEKFNPDRFSEENKKYRHPMAYVPFGEGQRVCIGERFGMMQVKMALILLLTNYRLKLSSRTKVPLEIDSQSGVLSSKDPIYLYF